MVIGVYLIVFFITLSQYGMHQLKREIWPTIAVIKEVDLPGYFLENLDGIVMAAWVMVVYGTHGAISSCLWNYFRRYFQRKNPMSYLYLPLIPIIYSISLIPDNLIETNKIMGRILNYFAIISIMIIPTIYFYTCLYKKEEGKA